MTDDEYDSDDEEESPDDESRLDAVAAMRSWFHARFEDPANRTPYESAEGGYQWIWGGPHDAREELEAEFSGQYPEEWIAQAVEDLEHYCVEWAPVPSENDYDTSLFSVVASNTNPLGTLEYGLEVIEGLVDERIEPQLSASLLRLLYANCITVLETYLSDTFINHVLVDDIALQRFLDSNPDLRKQQVSLNDVIREAATIKDTVKRYLLDVVWHNLAKVQAMYRGALRIEFGDTIGDVARSIPRRHDIVHRNGRDKDGIEVVALRDDVLQLAGAVRSMAQAIEACLPDSDLPM